MLYVKQYFNGIIFIFKNGGVRQNLLKPNKLKLKKVSHTKAYLTLLNRLEYEHKNTLEILNYNSIFVADFVSLF